VEDWSQDDPLLDPDDPEARAREQRRREREARRRERVRPDPAAEPRAPAAAAPAAPAEQVGEPPPPPPPPPAAPPPAPRGTGPLDRLPGGWVAVAAALAGLLLLGFLIALVQPFNGDSGEPATAPTATVTIPEGLSRAQIAPLVRHAGLRGSYVKTSIRSKYLDPDRYGAQGRARNLEGFLFPDTFELERRAPVSDLVQRQLQDFERRIKGVDMSYARSKNLTTYDVLIIASMIEREAQIPRERALVAAVIYNRLHDGMPLGIDATTRFAVGNYTQPLTTAQLNSPSLYNTRLRAGLPPGPIGNPGLAAIEAAARPAKVDYLFYVVKPGSCGEHNFSSTEAQFARDRDAYQQALQEQGSSPTSC
jgi:cell division protein YceG involved in septum cleavage